MGPCFREDDHLISSVLDLANLRFAPSVLQGLQDGIRELKSLQEEFGVFSEEHSLADSFAVLGLGGFWNPGLKNKFYDYLGYLARTRFQMEGSETGQTGDRGIITALVENFALERPYPVYFTTHDGKKNPRVLADRKRPLVYMEDEYLTISLPMTPWLERPRSR
jgi:hypothetical protein